MLFSAIMEIRRHRSVVADDEARVRSVVRDALGRAELIMAPLGTAALRIHDIDAICTRAAKQLAMARTGVSEDELRGLQLMRLHLEEGGHDWRDSTAMDDVRSARALLD